MSSYGEIKKTKMTSVNKIVYHAINILLVLLGLWALYFLSFFWIGSIEQHQQIIESSSVSYFIKRFGLNLILVVFFLGLVIILNRSMTGVMQSSTLPKKILFIDLLVYMIASAFMIFLSMEIDG